MFFFVSHKNNLYKLHVFQNEKRFYKKELKKTNLQKACKSLRYLIRIFCLLNIEIHLFIFISIQTTL